MNLTPQHAVQHGQQLLPARAMLIGKTGIEGLLRSDPSLQIMRARSAMEAIGELSEFAENGPEAEHTDARPLCVLVGPGLIESGLSEPFVSALHKIEPGAIVLSTGRQPVLPGFDGRVDEQASPEILSNLIRGLPLTAPAAFTTASFPPIQPASVSPAPAPASASFASQAAPIYSNGHARAAAPAATPQHAVLSATPAASFIDPMHDHAPDELAMPIPSEPEQSPLKAILNGQDGIAAALQITSSRLRTPCRFIPGASLSSENISQAITAIDRTARVMHMGRMLGVLVAQGLSQSALEPEAEWLAGWVALAIQQEQLRKAAFTDELTGAWNRRYFKRFLSAAIDQSRGARHTVSLLCFDIDNFKSYNDRYGHGAGDEILQEAVQLLKSVIRPSDRVCRVGGDEFAVIFHDPDGPRNPGSGVPLAPDSIAQIAKRFQKQICEHRFPKLHADAPGTLTISGGMATFPWDGTTPDELLCRADELAMQSKRIGKNLITFGPGAQKACGVEL